MYLQSIAEIFGMRVWTKIRSDILDTVDMLYHKDLQEGIWEFMTDNPSFQISHDSYYPIMRLVEKGSYA
jgi:hypothetical protein